MSKKPRISCERHEPDVVVLYGGREAECAACAQERRIAALVEALEAASEAFDGPVYAGFSQEEDARYKMRAALALAKESKE